MVKSMTGYGRGERQTAQRKITVELKSLNGKQLDLSARMPSIYREKEYEIRGAVARALSRGKVDLMVNIEQLSTSKSSTINREMFRNYYLELSEIASQVGCGTENILQTILKLPEVMQSENVSVSDDEWQALMAAAAEAIANIDNFRTQEGAMLMNDLLERVNIIESLMNDVATFEPERIETVRIRLAENIAKLKIDIDTNRFEQELIYYIEKFDITEEKVRLAGHCNYFRSIAAAQNDESIGRKLGFIAQEMGREINTMGSKANHVEIQKRVVMMKDELEKIKEQLLNIL